MPVELTRVRFSADEYHRIVEAGVLGEDDRVELIAGELVRISPVGRLYAVTARRLDRAAGTHSRRRPDPAVLRRNVLRGRCPRRTR